MLLLKKYFIYIIVGVFLLTVVSNSSTAFAEVCVSDTTAVDLITLLDASERDLELLNDCTKLVNELHKEVKERDERIVTLTNDLINANQKVITYKRKYKTARKVAWYTSAAAAILVIIEILPYAL